MSSNAVEVRNLSKVYRIYNSDLERALAPFKKKNTAKRFVALDSLNLDFPKGEVVAILGKNGSGKSTLLKIVTGVVSPTSGTLKVDGRISAMLELTAGFDRDLTGIENIYLRALALGISREEIEPRRDEIIKFADIGEHINQPVRTYSSGMRARLGFAVSVNVDPDILIIDEVLAVGDDTFRLKCIERMREFRQAGKTILFVSHSLATVRAFCTLGIWLDKGKVRAQGEIGPVTQEYEDFLRLERARQKREEGEDVDLPEKRTDILETSDFMFTNASGEKNNRFREGEDIYFQLTYTVKRPIGQLRFCWGMRNAEEVEVYASDKRDGANHIDSSLGTHTIRVRLDNPRLLAGSYRLFGEIWDTDSVFKVGFSTKRRFFIEQEEYVGSGIIPIDYSLTVDNEEVR